MWTVSHEAGTTIHIASIFSVEMKIKHETSRGWQQASAGFLPDLHFDPDDASDTFLRNIS
jgi:hypothetical protein